MKANQRSSVASSGLRWLRGRSNLIGALLLPPFLSATLLPSLASAQAAAEQRWEGVPADLQRGAQEGHAAPAEALPSLAEVRGDVAKQVAESGIDNLASSAVASESLQQGIDRGELLKTAARAQDGAPAEAPAAPAARHAGDVSPQSISLPGGSATVSGLGESFTAQLSTGIATFSVPLAAPAARGATQLPLGLAYASSGGAGLAGLGWSLPVQSAIARQTAHGLPRYDDRSDWHPEQDRFVFNGQELVPICRVNGGSCSGALAGEVFPAWASGWQYFRARVEGVFLRFFWAPDHLTWRVQSKEGINIEFGVPLDGSGYRGALTINPDPREEIHAWNIVRQYDSHGAPNATPHPLPTNPIVYRYFDDGGATYLSDVFYTSPAADPTTVELGSYAHHVALRYDQRTDPAVSYRTGWAVEQRLRLSRVDIASKPFSGGPSGPRELVRRYHLAYDAEAHASLLVSVQMEGRCSVPVEESPEQELPPTSCPRLPAITFEYERPAGRTSAPLLDSQGGAFEPFNEDVVALENSPSHSVGNGRAALADINSDGLPDVLVTAPESFGGQHAAFFGGLAPSGSIGFGNAERIAVTGVADVNANVLKLSNPNVAPLDADGDGRLDLVHMPLVKKYSVFTPERTAEGWRWLGRPIATASGQSPKINFTQDARHIAVTDVNGDGLVDVVFSSSTELQTFFALGRYPGGDAQFGHAERTGPESARISNEPVTTCLPWSATPVRFGDGGVSIADMNGDGLPDIVRARSGQVLYWPGRGNGYFGTGERDDCRAGSFGRDRHLVMQNGPRFGAGTLQFSDVNGDGLSDAVEIRFDAVDIYLNENGTSWTRRHTLSNVPNRSSSNDPVRLTDINGSGTLDILWGRGHDYRYVDLAGGARPNVLVRTHNGLGRTMEIEYSSSARLMVAATAAGNPWSSVMPTTVPVVVRSTIRDNLEKIGRPAGVYTTEYSYRDPVFDGRQREFRGFRTAEVRQVGDPYAPTSIGRSTFLLGECIAAQNGYDVCSPSERWRDNWREALKGLISTAEVADENGVYASTSHTSYELRQLYVGRDGRSVSVAFPGDVTSFGYDTGAFQPSATSISLTDVEVNVTGISQVEQRSVVRRAAQDTARLVKARTFDDFGNQSLGQDYGCVEGCSPVDDVLRVHSTYERPAGDGSGWLWRLVSTHVDSSHRPLPRNQHSTIYDAAGDVRESRAILSGTLALARSHSGGAAVAPDPPNASGGASAPVEIVERVVERDVFGNVIGSRAPPSRCRSVEYDTAYAEFAVLETSYGGELGQDGCGVRPFSVEAEYDRGLALVVAARDATGQPSRSDYDGFGRLLAFTRADPGAPGQLAPFPTSVFEYSLPEDPAETPYFVLHSFRQDGTDAGDDEYHEAATFVDGLGREIANVSEADPAAGDAGEVTVSGATDYSAKGTAIRIYEPWFGTGSPNTASPPEAAATRYAQVEYDAFGRTTVAYGLDGRPKQATVYHALANDVWDAGDLDAGPHRGTFFTTRRDGHGRVVAETERVRVGESLEEHHTLYEYLSTGEAERIVRRRAGSPDVVRWARYDSLGRLVQNVDPNTTPNFSPDPATPANSLQAWRYAYDDAGNLVGTSDPRGCGVNYHLDAATRLLAEDYSPCESQHQTYSAPNFTAGTGIEVSYRYDFPDPDGASIVDAGGRTLAIDANLLYGRVASIADRATKRVVRYDALGRLTGGAVRIAKPGEPANALSERYAPRWYVREIALDAFDRMVRASTGATSAELLGPGDASEVTFSFGRNAQLQGVGSSYGSLVAGRSLAADGRLRELRLGDGAETTRSFEYDELRRLKSVQTYRATPGLWSQSGYPALGNEPTQQLLLEDYDFTYDGANNIIRITDYRDPSDWPAGAKPVTRHYEYDNLYRLTRARYESAGGDSWQSPFAAELAGEAPGPKPSPHVAFDNRVLEQTYRYDHLDNLVVSDDDAAGFYDRSLGTQTHGSSTSGPHRLVTASNRTLSAASPRKGDLETRYDVAGNLVDLVVRRDGACAPSGASCWQRYGYQWDELGQLARARRWDLRAAGPDERASHGQVTSALPSRAADADLTYAYESAGSRVRKTAIDAQGNASHDVYVFSSLELRRTWWTSSGGGGALDYALTSQTEQVRLGDGQIHARVLYAEEDLPSLSSGRQHVFLEFSDYLGSSAIVIDRQTGELVQYSTYQAYGLADSEFRPGRWGNFREPYRFTGKEEDVEVGLAYFGKRYLSLGLSRWISPDPVNIHYFGGGQNPYAYVNGQPTIAVDPDGGNPFLIAAAVGFVVGTLMNAGQQHFANPGGNIDWGHALLHGGLPGAVGGLAGPLGPMIGGYGGALVAGGLGNGLGYLTTAVITGQGDFNEFLLAVAQGSALGVAGHGLGEFIKNAKQSGGGGNAPSGTAGGAADDVAASNKAISNVDDAVDSAQPSKQPPPNPKPKAQPSGPKASITPDKGEIAPDPITPAAPNPPDKNPIEIRDACKNVKCSTPGAFRNIDKLIKEAQAQYPNKAGKIEHHHITPKYLGGDPGGPTVPIDAAYHQKITNEFRSLWDYGTGRTPSPQELADIMRKVYTKYPLPGL